MDSSTDGVVVLDIGTDTCKVGAASDAEPKLFPTEVVEKSRGCFFFEDLDVPSLCIKNKAVLSLYASEHLVTKVADPVSGVVFQCGERAAHVVPVHEGRALQQNIRLFDICGKDLTDYLMSLLKKDSEGVLITDAYRKSIKRMKEKECRVTQKLEEDEEETETTGQGKRYLMGDEQPIRVNPRVFNRVPEALFDPDRLGKHIKPVQEEIYETIKSCGADIQQKLFDNILLAGGSTLFEGLAERMTKELARTINDSSVRFKITACQHRYSAWYGGCRFVSLDGFQKLLISKQQYDEEGPEVINSMCF